MCQCPKRANLHFYFTKEVNKHGSGNGCVNALSGRTFISTYCTDEDLTLRVEVSMP